MPLRKEPEAEPIPGYRLIERLGKGGCGEVWKCEAPGGLYKAIKFVYGNLNGLDNDRSVAAEELRAIEHIKTIRHPFLLSMERVECLNGELVIVSELADKSLHQLQEEFRRHGREGVPRPQLLSYLREAAEVLDLLHFEYGLQHLDVKPRNLFLVHHHIKVADFGLVSSLTAAGASPTANLQLGAITPLYAAPEIFQGQISPHSDQYSLAVTFQELLTGSLPFEGPNSRTLLMQHTGHEPDLSRLSSQDREVVARALSKDPLDRFPSCMDFLEALSPHAVRSAATDLPAPQIAPLPAVLTPLPRPALAPRPEADTDVSLQGLTERRRPQPHTGNGRPAREILPEGYQFVKCLENTPLLERWQIQTADNQVRLLKILHGANALGNALTRETLLRLQSLEHPGLTRMEVLKGTPGRILLVTDLADQSLRDYLHRCQGRKLRGIPRADLLSFLVTAAETLDYLYRQHSIQHLNLSPRHLVLDQGRLLIDEFGLAQLIWLPADQLLAQPGKRYAAPELIRGQISPSCDQYSLALIYVELLTGNFPRGSQKERAVAPVVLDTLPAEDAEIVARALHADPNRRWPSCLDFIRALERGQFTGGLSEQAGHDDFAALVDERKPGPAADAQGKSICAAALQELVASLIQSAGGEVDWAAQEQPPELSPDGLSLRHKFSAGVPLGEARLKLDQVREQLYGQLKHDDGRHYCFHLNMPSDFWSKWTGRPPGLEVGVTLSRHNVLVPTPIDILVTIEAYRCNRKRGKELLEEMGLPLLEQLRAVMLVNSEKRVQERLLWPHSVQIWPILPDGSRGDTVTCRGKDISLSGIGFYLPHQLDSSAVMINLPATDQTEAISIPATLVRARPCADGWYEVGALFRLSTFRNTDPGHQCLRAAGS